MALTAGGPRPGGGSRDPVSWVMPGGGGARQGRTQLRAMPGTMQLTRAPLESGESHILLKMEAYPLL